MITPSGKSAKQKPPKKASKKRLDCNIFSAYLKVSRGDNREWGLAMDPLVGGDVAPVHQEHQVGQNGRRVRLVHFCDEIGVHGDVGGQAFEVSCQAVIDLESSNQSSLLYPFGSIKGSIKGTLKHYSWKLGRPNEMGQCLFEMNRTV